MSDIVQKQRSPTAPVISLSLPATASIIPAVQLSKLLPIYSCQLVRIWESDRRIPTLASRRAWALARGIEPKYVSNWWYRRKDVAQKLGITIPDGQYDLDAEAGMEDLKVKTEAVSEVLCLPQKKTRKRKHQVGQGETQELKPKRTMRKRVKFEALDCTSSSRSLDVDILAPQSCSSDPDTQSSCSSETLSTLSSGDMYASDHDASTSSPTLPSTNSGQLPPSSKPSKRRSRAYTQLLDPLWTSPSPQGPPATDAAKTKSKSKMAKTIRDSEAEPDALPLSSPLAPSSSPTLAVSSSPLLEAPSKLSQPVFLCPSCSVPFYSDPDDETDDEAPAMELSALPFLYPSLFPLWSTYTTCEPSNQSGYYGYCLTSAHFAFDGSFVSPCDCLRVDGVKANPFVLCELPYAEYLPELSSVDAEAGREAVNVDRESKEEERKWILML